MTEVPVTLFNVDDVSGYMITHALTDTLAQIDPAAMTLVRHVEKSYGETLWYDYIPATSHVLVIQYDGWVLDGTRWQDSWLEYDYIGAPWPWHRPEIQVGNGGFSLRSTRLMKFLAGNKDMFPVRDPEDVALCVTYRAALEAHGFKWAPVSVAREFAFEREALHPTFGFHGLFNLPHVLDEIALKQRLNLANDYVRSHPAWNEVAEFAK